MTLDFSLRAPSCNALPWVKNICLPESSLHLLTGIAEFLRKGVMLGLISGK